MSEWHEADVFWRAFYPVMFPESRWAVAPEQVDLALSLLGVDEPVDILDFCCGPGRHTLALAQLGHRVLGVDRTAFYLDMGRKKAIDMGVDVTFEQCDVRAFKQVNAFDCAVSLFTSFGYFEAIEDDMKVLENMYAALRPNGKVLMDLSGKEVVAKAFTDRGWSEPEPGVVWLEERSVMPEWAGIKNKWTLVRGKETFTHTLSIRLYSGLELKKALLAVGFKHVNLYGSLEGDPYDDRARRLVAVGVK